MLEATWHKLEKSPSVHNDKNLHQPSEAHQIIDFWHAVLRLDVYSLWPWWMTEDETSYVTAFQTSFLLLVYLKQTESEKTLASGTDHKWIRIPETKAGQGAYFWKEELRYFGESSALCADIPDGQTIVAPSPSFWAFRASDDLMRSSLEK